MVDLHHGTVVLQLYLNLDSNLDYGRTRVPLEVPDLLLKYSWLAPSSAGTAVPTKFSRY